MTEPLRVVEIDDWAFRRNHRYGSIVCDLEQRRIVALLPDREVATVEAWLARHPEIEILWCLARTKLHVKEETYATRWHVHSLYMSIARAANNPHVEISMH